MRIGIFCDVPNLYKSLGLKYGRPRLDYTKFRDYWGVSEISCCHAFGVAQPDTFNFAYYLSTNGYETDFRKHWCPDVAITVKVLQQLEFLDVVVLGTNNGYFVDLLNEIVSRGKQGMIMGCNIGPDLKSLAAKTIEIPKSMTLES